MEQTRRPRDNRRRAPGQAVATLPLDHDGADGTGAADRSRTRDVQVTYGAGIQTFPLAGQRVASVRAILGSMLQVDARAAILVNGADVGAEYVLRQGDRVEVVHHSGEKG